MDLNVALDKVAKGKQDSSSYTLANVRSPVPPPA